MYNTTRNFYLKSCTSMGNEIESDLYKIKFAM